MWITSWISADNPCFSVENWGINSYYVILRMGSERERLQKISTYPHSHFLAPIDFSFEISYTDEAHIFRRANLTLLEAPNNRGHGNLKGSMATLEVATTIRDGFVTFVQILTAVSVPNLELMCYY